MSDNFVGLVAIMMTFGIPMTVIWTSHQRKMLELQAKLRQGNQDDTLRATVEALREEVRSLRDTTMQYDLSFDTALQNIEGRVQAVERQSQITPSYQSNEDKPQNLTLGGR